jgi:AcrR family transcriptional regulator
MMRAIVKSDARKTRMTQKSGSTKPDIDLIWVREARKGADRRPALSRERVVEAAIELADERGLDAVTSRAIATRLGAGPTSMYFHVSNRADLYELMSDAALGEITLPDAPSGDWRKDLWTLAREMHRLFGKHPWFALLGIQPGIGPNSRRYGEYAIAVLTGIGLETDRAIEATAVMNNYIFGFAQRKAAWEQLSRRAGLEQHWGERLERYLADVENSDPILAGYIKTRFHLTNDENFDLGLNCVLDGMAAHLDI